MTANVRYEIGDLVKIKDDCAMPYFAGKLAIITRQMGVDRMDVVGGYYYEVILSGTTKNHIFNHSELELLSRRK
tara:strand:- start:2336 stop:2557 length:222 start_codon:yes stop_codon:yes gene_type:complete